MKIIRTYILKEFTGPFFISLSVLTFVFLLGNLIRLADMVVAKGVSIFLVGKLFFYLMPYLLSYTLPVAILSGLLLSLGRLSSDNEIVALRAVGINPIRIIAPLITLGMIFSLFALLINGRFIPQSHFATRKVLTEIGVKNPTAALEAGTFIDAFQGYTLFIYRIEGNKLENIRIYEPQGEGKPARTIVARRGEFISLPKKKMIKLKLMDGTSDEPDPNTPGSFYKLNFDQYFMTLNIAKTSDAASLEKKPKDMTIDELSMKMEEYSESGIDPLPLLINLNKRISLSFACFVFILLGAPLAMITKQRAKSINFGLSFLIVALYYILLISAETVSLRGIMFPAFNIWIPNILFTLVGIILTWRVCAS